MSHDFRSRRVDKGYSLATLFLLISASAAVLALVTPLLRSLDDEIGLSEFAVAIIAGGIVLGAIGLFVGLFSFSRLQGTLIGAMLGIVLGTLAGPLVFVPTDDFSMILALAAGGVALVLGLAAVIRLGGGGWRKADTRVEPRRRPHPRPHPLDPDPDEGP